MTPAFGIDFGTTNTRVAYFDGERVRMVPFVTNNVTRYQVPTLVSYQDGEPVAFGQESRGRGTAFPQPLKWILGSPEPVEVPGGSGGQRDPVRVAADFLEFLRAQVSRSLPTAPWDRVAVTIPVHYPPAARDQLDRAFRLAGIRVTNFFFEPIAAIYAGLIDDPIAGVAAVFDWGGGSLDIATVQVRDGVALTRQVDGWHRGGTHFDRAVAEQAVDDFLAQHPGVEPGYTTQTVLDRTQAGRNLLLRAEEAKIDLSRAAQTRVNYLRFFAGVNLDYRLDRTGFEDLIGPDLTGGIARLDRALAGSRVTRRTLARLFLSGGTCNIPLIRERLTAEVAGHHVAHALRLPAALRDPRSPGGLDDIGNATAVGAALLAVHGAEPEFATDVGIRLAGCNGDRFFPVFRAGEPVRFGTVTHRFYVSEAGPGVARLLVCDRADEATEPGGRLLRLITAPVNRDERWLEVGFTLDRHLTLRVDAAGQCDLPNIPGQSARPWPHPPAWVPSLNLGFRLPTFAVAAAP